MAEKSNNKVLWISLAVAVIVSAIIGGVLYLKDFYKNINFEFRPSGNLGDLLSSLLAAQNPNNKNERSQDRGAGIYIDIPAKTIIDNANKIGINIKDIFASIKYNNEVVLRTKPDSKVLQEVNIPPQTQGLEINDTIEILINPSSVKLINELIKKSNPEVEITIRGKSLGIPLKRTFKQSLNV